MSRGESPPIWRYFAAILGDFGQGERLALTEKASKLWAFVAHRKWWLTAEETQ